MTSARLRVPTTQSSPLRRRAVLRTRPPPLRWRRSSGAPHDLLRQRGCRSLGPARTWCRNAARTGRSLGPARTWCRNAARTGPSLEPARTWCRNAARTGRSLEPARTWCRNAARTGRSLEPARSWCRNAARTGRSLEPARTWCRNAARTGRSLEPARTWYRTKKSLTATRCGGTRKVVPTALQVGLSHPRIRRRRDLRTRQVRTHRRRWRSPAAWGCRSTPSRLPRGTLRSVEHRRRRCAGR
jgi:hypothetical protein